MSKRSVYLAESSEEVREDLLLLRLGMMGNHTCHTLSEVRCLLRITDYIEQHVRDIFSLLPEKG